MKWFLKGFYADLILGLLHFLTRVFKAFLTIFFSIIPLHASSTLNHFLAATPPSLHCRASTSISHPLNCFDLWSLAVLCPVESSIATAAVAAQSLSHEIVTVMEKFTKKILSSMKSEGLYENHGGPIILSQVIELKYN
ncbi:hypothetical protein L1987_37921 [Smallanthus sonchifolius]|uniref:Uncharacterized protein n=1 Tax=Smallanthus sonchifolius TaxID=185202 RepID=A0ACB9HHS1_9ASTR|nr:hypothetical protein L1987_37921 [Smallanthus sonchifolius]